MSAISAHRESPSYEPMAPVRGNAQPRLLIIDDDPRALRIFRRILQQADRHCLAFQRAEEMIDALQENAQVDVILSDLRMQQIDGIGLIKRIRTQFKDRPWLQFILVTGQATMDTAVSALRLEAVDYLFKPVMPKELLSAVNSAMQRTRQLRFRLAQPDKALHAEQLSQLARSANMLAAELARFSQGSEADLRDGQGQADLTVGNGDSADPASVEQSRAALRVLSSLGEQKGEIFGDALSPDPAWEMLLELMIGRFTGRRTCVTSLCLASKTPLTTALRRIDALIDAGLVVRSRDLDDRRRTYVQLSELGVQKMQQYLASAGKLGIGLLPAPSADSLSIGRTRQ